MARRKPPAAGLSLFAFQDIITGVAGVMLFILMILVVQLAIQSGQSASKATETNENLVEAASLDTIQEEIERLKESVQSKSREQRSNKSKIDLLLDANVSNIEKAIQDGTNLLSKLLQDLAASATELQKAHAENTAMFAENPAGETLEQIGDLEEKLRETQAELEEWNDDSRVNYATDNKVDNLYLLDVQEKYCDAASLPIQQPPTRIAFSSASAESIAPTLTLWYESLPPDKKDPKKRIVFVIRPSAAVFGIELATEMRSLGFKVALELLESKAKLFRKPKNSSGTKALNDGTGVGKP